MGGTLVAYHITAMSMTFLPARGPVPYASLHPPFLPGHCLLDKVLKKPERKIGMMTKTWTQVV